VPFHNAPELALTIMKLGMRSSALVWSLLASPACGVAFMTAIMIASLAASYALAQSK
jgi:hypothetical protein